MGSGAAALGTPVGFREADSGLVVPEELSRGREVWTKAEAKLLDRTVKLLGSRGLQMMFRCTHARCKSAGPITRLRGKGGEMILRCEHLDREFTRAF